jgi:hypothetical protein
MAALKYFVPIVVLIGITGCANDSGKEIFDNTLSGEWYLAEVLADPGDGSGTFQPTTQELKLQIFSSGLYISSESLCNAGSGMSGTFDIEEGKIYPVNCNYSLGFKVEEGELYVYFPCIEPCAYKFRRK